MTRRVLRVPVAALVLVLIAYTIGPVAAAGTPNIFASRSSGAAGTSVTVTGTAFGLSESNISIMWDGLAIVTGLFADSAGVWSATFIVPPSAGGPHIIDASGSATTAATVNDLVFTVLPTISMSRTGGPPGTTVSVTGAGFAVNETGIAVTWDGTQVASGVSASAQGAWSASFVAPASTAGGHIIDAFGSTSAATSVPDLTFTISAGITVNRTTGAPGTSVIVTGSGFGASEGGITVTYDSVQVITGVTASAQGSWTATFVVPSSTAGAHVIDASGSTTTAASIADITFNISPTITINRTSGMVGTSITVNGAGFGANETNIVVTYDRQQVLTGITANSEGIWTGTFVVPSSAAGSHSIDASGSNTAATSVPDVTFSIGPSITINRNSGTVGSTATVSGSGFGVSETAILITYDGTPITTGVTASPQGVWSANITIPPSASGPHTIKAQGSVTAVGAAGELSYTVAPTLTVNPSGGNVGGTVELSGTGFAPNSPIRFTYDDKEVSPEAKTTDASGGFARSVTVPKSPAGPHTFRVTDGQRNDLKASFVMESTPPPAPTPVAPEDGVRLSIVGGISPAFRWTEVRDPSGVAYNLQVDTTIDFFQPVVEKTEISTNRYTLSATEALPQGQYYWRVKAVDGASNESAWSQPRLLQSGIMPLWSFILIILGGLAVIAATIFMVVPRLRARRRAPVAIPEPEMPQIVPGQWRSVDTEEGPRERPLPFRLALPQPTKGAKTYSTEDQARLKVIIDFAQSLPLAEPGYNVNWLIDMLEGGTGLQASVPVYDQLLKGELQVRYEPTWMRHPTYQDLTAMLEGQPILQDLNGYVDAVNRCAGEDIQVLQDIFRDASTEVRIEGFLERGGWGFVSAIYADAISWFLGKSLRDPSERDYTTKPRGGAGEEGGLWLYGEAVTCFAGPLLQVADESQSQEMKGVHLKLRRAYRNNARARQLVGMLTQLEVQRSRLLNVLSQIGRLKQ